MLHIAHWIARIAYYSNLEALYTQTLTWLQPLTVPVLSPLWALSCSTPRFRLLAKQSSWQTHLSLQLQWSFLCMNQPLLPFSKLLPTHRASNLAHHLLHPLPPIIPFLLSSVSGIPFSPSVRLWTPSSSFSFLPHKSNQLLSSDSFYHLDLPLVSLHSKFSCLLLAENLPELLPRQKSFDGSLCPTPKTSTLACQQLLWAIVLSI